MSVLLSVGSVYGSDTASTNTLQTSPFITSPSAVDYEAPGDDAEEIDEP